MRRKRISRSIASSDLRTPNDTTSFNSLTNHLGEYGRWVEQMIADGWNAYLTNFMFREITGSPKYRLSLMKDEVERVYSTIITRVERKPRSPHRLMFLPRFIGCLDKTTRTSMNGDGDHVNGVFLFPLKSRLRKHPIDLIADDQSTYIPPGGPLLRIDLKAIHRTPRKAVDYTFKTIKRGYTNEEDILVLPKSLHEIRGPEVHDPAPADQENAEAAARRIVKLLLRVASKAKRLN